MNTLALLSAPIIPAILRLAAPNMLAMTVMLATSAAEAWYVGQLGTTALAGLALAFPMFMLMTMMSAGAMGGAVAGAIAQALGAEDRGHAERLLIHSILIAFVAGGVFSLIFLSLGPSIYSVLGGSDQVLQEALAFSNILFAGCISIWLLNFLSSVVRGCGHMRTAAVIMIITSFSQIGLGALLVFGWGPIPGLGISGAALAAVLGASFGSLLLILFLMSGTAAVRLHLKEISFRRADFAHLLRPGLLACVSPLSSVGSAIVITALVARLGPETLAGYGIGVRLEFLLIPIIFGIGAALITMVGVHFGAGEVDRGHKIAWIGAFGAALVTGFIGGLLALFPDLWANLFTDVEAVREACRLYLRIAGPTYGFFGLGLSLYFASQGARRLFWPVAAGAFRLIIVSVGGLILIYYWSPTIENVFALVALGMITLGITIATAIKLGAWR
ncbi:MATE family efflux transporter [Sneathiella marina]|uniref:MATE family efflux transporter n=1 Tax=Sneathiella marina TaxID=2950108 RepID=A0ABY4W3M0_9PROT|nr:MATE family efflux transporter [Sneathiella marina]USG61797.1 MATE family efflux transporter [Sneathiella marina]